MYSGQITAQTFPYINGVQTGRSETSINNYHHTLCNIQEGYRSHQIRGASQQSYNWMGSGKQDSHEKVNAPSPKINCIQFRIQQISLGILNRKRILVFFWPRHSVPECKVPYSTLEHLDRSPSTTSSTTHFAARPTIRSHTACTADCDIK